MVNMLHVQRYADLIRNRGLIWDTMEGIGILPLLSRLYWHVLLHYKQFKDGIWKSAHKS